MQTFGDLIGHNTHCHILVTNGCFYGNRISPNDDTVAVETAGSNPAMAMILPEHSY